MFFIKPPLYMDKDHEFTVVLNHTMTDSASLRISVKTAEKDSLVVSFVDEWARKLSCLRPTMKIAVTVRTSTNHNICIEGEPGIFSIVKCTVSRSDSDFLKLDGSANIIEEKPANWLRPGNSNSLTPLTSINPTFQTANVGGAFMGNLPPGAKRYTDAFKGDYFSNNVLLADLSFSEMSLTSIRQLNDIPQFSLQLWTTSKTIEDLPWLKMGQVIRATCIVPRIKDGMRWNLYFRQRASGGSKIQIFENEEAPADLKEIAEWVRREISSKSLMPDGFKGELATLESVGVDVVIQVANDPDTNSFIADDMKTTVQVKMKEDESSAFVLKKIKKGDWLLCRNVRKVQGTAFINPHYITPLPVWSFDVQQSMKHTRYEEDQAHLFIDEKENADEDERIVYVQDSQVFFSQFPDSPEPKKRKM